MTGSLQGRGGRVGGGYLKSQAPLVLTCRLSSSQQKIFRNVLKCIFFLARMTHLQSTYSSAFLHYYDGSI